MLLEAVIFYVEVFLRIEQMTHIAVVERPMTDWSLHPLPPSFDEIKYNIIIHLPKLVIIQQQAVNCERGLPALKGTFNWIINLV